MHVRLQSDRQPLSQCARLQVRRQLVNELQRLQVVFQRPTPALHRACSTTTTSSSDRLLHIVSTYACVLATLTLVAPMIAVDTLVFDAACHTVT